MEQGAGNVNAILTGVSTIASSVIVQSSQEEPSNIALTGSYSESRRSLSAAPSATPSPVLSPSGKIFGKNSNGTMIATSTPSNEAELQLYRVLQRASLLAYYDTLLEMGGDDVQQLCDAGEEEFLEIMALVGMASKPLHVRRLQKALHEWVNNPSAFQTPLPTIDPIHLMYSPEPTTSRPKHDPSPSFNPTPLMSTAHSNSSVLLHLSAGVSSQVSSSSCSQLTPCLTEAQISTLAVGAEKLARQITQREPRAQNSKKRTSRELEQVMTMSDSDPRRMDEIRKFAAIYGRFDCKRKPEKPLTLHEICVNEAAAQICKFVPALLTRRDELFPFARQLVKDSGLGHSSSIARFGLGQHQMSQKIDDSENIGMPKRARLIANDNNPADYTKDIIEESRTSFLAIYQKLGRSFDVSDITKFSLCRSDYDDNDSRHSFSRSDYEDNSLPLGTNMNGPEAETISHDYCGTNEEISRKGSPRRDDVLQTSPLGVQVISASGSHIIAVANPALALSSSLNDSFSVKRETSPSI